MVTARFDCQISRAVSSAVLSSRLGSFVVEVIEPVSVTSVPGGEVARVATVSTNGVEPPEKVAIVQVIGPVPPGAGVVQLQPGGVGIETNVEVVGTLKATVVLAASSGPSLFAVSVN